MVSRVRNSNPGKHACGDHMIIAHSSRPKKVETEEKGEEEEEEQAGRGRGRRNTKGATMGGNEDEGVDGRREEKEARRGNGEKGETEGENRHMGETYRALSRPHQSPPSTATGLT
mmetsp:Transcript_8354/g.21934  ORF Transcript_8354/g.21934 Transcript_8354/m.21934 type:complete len:115 (-) Transcript_8354:1112-1456(-)